MKLYFSPGACSLSPHIALLEAGLSFDKEQVDLRAKKTKSGTDFLTINPKGQVPTLQLDNGEILTEGPALVQYIADQKPASNLAPPAGTFDRYRLQEWLNFVSTELHKGFSPLWRPTTPDDYKKIARENLAGKFAYLDKHFAKNQFLMGDNFSVADGYCFTVLNWAKPLNIDLSPWPNLVTYMGRVGARPKVKEAMKGEGLTT
ncbi:MAG: glutathione transferase GstA [Alphaproteobacteria bacterium]